MLHRIYLITALALGACVGCSMPTTMVAMEAEIGDCSICLDSIISETYTATIPCNHLFHVNCLKKYQTNGQGIVLQKPCPNCRKKITGTDDEIAQSIVQSLQDEQDKKAHAACAEADLKKTIALSLQEKEERDRKKDRDQKQHAAQIAQLKQEAAALIDATNSRDSYVDNNKTMTTILTGLRTRDPLAANIVQEQWVQLAPVFDVGAGEVGVGRGYPLAPPVASPVAGRGRAPIHVPAQSQPVGRGRGNGGVAAGNGFDMGELQRALLARRGQQG